MGCACLVVVSVYIDWVLTCSSCAFFFFKQKTAYEMRISDWSSDVCSSDLLVMRAYSGLAGPEDPRPRPDQMVARRENVVDFVAEMEIGRASCRERVCQYV